MDEPRTVGGRVASLVSMISRQKPASKRLHQLRRRIYADMLRRNMPSITGEQALARISRPKAPAPRVTAEAIAVLRRQGLAALIYGSWARGTPGQASDLDVLELVANNPKPYSKGYVNVTQYTAAHLREMASRGSPFIAHLIVEGQIISDDRCKLVAALEVFQFPDDYCGYLRELGAAGLALHLATLADFAEYGLGLARAGMYLIRTAAYIRNIERGRLVFDMSAVARHLALPTLNRALALRIKDPQYAYSDLAVLAEGLRELAPYPAVHAASVEALAVELSADMPHAAALLASVLAHDAVLDYAALPIGPI